MPMQLTDGQLDLPANPANVDRLPADLGIKLPSDYLSFLRQHNGGEGFIGENYIILWKAEELATFNREYEVQKYAPGILLFGSSGGGEGYGFDTQADMCVVQVPFIGMDRAYARPIALSFSDLFDALLNEGKSLS